VECPNDLGGVGKPAIETRQELADQLAELLALARVASGAQRFSQQPEGRRDGFTAQLAQEAANEGLQRRRFSRKPVQEAVTEEGGSPVGAQVGRGAGKAWHQAERLDRRERQTPDGAQKQRLQVGRSPGAARLVLRQMRKHQREVDAPRGRLLPPMGVLQARRRWAGPVEEVPEREARSHVVSFHQPPPRLRANEGPQGALSTVQSFTRDPTRGVLQHTRDGVRVPP
jgi:hypothetical protein